MQGFWLQPLAEAGFEGIQLVKGVVARAVKP